MSVLPEYQEIHNELQAVIDNPPALGDTAQTNVINTLTADLSSPEAEKTLKDEMAALAGAAFEVDGSFNRIMKMFEKVETAGASPELIRDVRTLTSTWDGHHMRFTQLVWRSREVAGKAMAAADDFCRDFVPYLAADDVPLAEKKKEIDHYMAELERDEKASQDMSQGFTDLQKNVDAFQTEWRRVVQKYNLDAMNRRIDELNTLVKNLETTLSDLNKKIKDLTVAIKAMSAVSGILGFLSFICPIFLIGGLIGVSSVAVARSLKAKAENERNKVTGDIARNKAERAQIQATLKAVQQLKAGLDGSQMDFNIISAKLGTFAHVWAVIRADIQAIKEKLDYASGTDSKALFKARMNNATKLYASLAIALREYQNLVTNDHPMFMKLNA
ncbi:hypothetical protein EIP91_011906 [Steccherinum ochraceum]|uniref:Uncharacterized protein n=1 Tax=Steccherinum ochraceum TaxID=92696 RepID=A0A4R0RXS5_9APHY|nr:hypothetical protein EIP91_011906 [Steccherinum ochraceum]